MIHKQSETIEKTVMGTFLWQSRMQFEEAHVISHCLYNHTFLYLLFIFRNAVVKTSQGLFALILVEVCEKPPGDPPTELNKHTPARAGGSTLKHNLLSYRSAFQCKDKIP